MNYAISHTTTYDYSKAVSVSHHLMRLAPRTGAQQQCVEHSITVQPTPAITNTRIDYFGNTTMFFTIQTPHEQLVVRAASQVRIEPSPAPVPADTPAWETVSAGFADDHAPQFLEAQEFVFDSPLIQANAELADYARLSFTAGRPLLDGVMDLTHRIHQDFKFDPKATTIATPLTEVFRARRGVCQDFAQLEIGCLRSLGLAARYVSGYLETSPPPGKPRLIGADASHAWIAVYCPGHGWIDVDPTNNLLPVATHITLAWGRDYNDVSPIRGVILGGGEHSLRVGVDVSPVAEP